jgi:threonyl-tRNA synthetase
MSEIRVRLPDGKRLAVPAGSTVLAVAERIGPGLAQAAVAGRLDGGLADLRTPLERDASLEVVTARDAAAGEVIRHSAEHVMADAVKRLFPSAQIDVGRTDHSEKFQYDFLVERPFTPEDLERIEQEMRQIIESGERFSREEVDREEARRLFAGLGEELKVARLGDIPADEPVTLFRHGEFVDLCRGPHVQRTDQIGAFKLLEVAGSYWKGDERNPMLQRIYGTAFASQSELDAHLARLEEAKRRDHRRLGVALDLFHVDPLSPGAPCFHPKGTTIYNALIEYMRALYRKYGYQEVLTPQIYYTELYKTSGHYDSFREDMFLFETEEQEMGVKPMNCPGHCLLFRSTKRSYRELPLRLAEFTRLHRNERSGTLQGLTRVRAFAQDDAHIFCEPEQMESEIERFFELTAEVYRDLALRDFELSVSTRGDEFIGDPADWKPAERLLVQAVERAGYPCAVKEGEAAFYGPKVEFDFRDVLGRSWTLATVQLDMAMPTRFGLTYVGRDGSDHRPAMLHRAVLGSIERFLAIYLEHTAGDFPLWLAPVQAVVLPITDRHADYGAKVCSTLSGRGIRAELDARSEKLGFKIREAETQKNPVMVVVGDQEVANGTVTPRRRRRERRSDETLPLDVFAAELAAEIADRRS